jgi:hypothetical protein
MTIENELKNYLSNTIGTQVAISKAGFGGMGTILIMELSNHYHLWVKCAWRLEKGNKIIAAAADEMEAETGFTDRRVSVLKGKTVDSVEMISTCDFCIRFIGGLCLRIFCVFAHTYEFDYNWEFRIPNEKLIFQLTNHCKIKKRKVTQ